MVLDQDKLVDSEYTRWFLPLPLLARIEGDKRAIDGLRTERRRIGVLKMVRMTRE